jgi:sulfur-oxidizing protein SoxY
MADFTGGAIPTPDTRVVIELPKDVATGNAVALTVRVESPMTEASHVSELLIVARDNRGAKVGRYTFFLPNGVPQVTTRIRLERAATPAPAQTVSVTAVAKVRQGGVESFLSSDRQASVTGGACEC